tara:strand:+ start:296 stop:472 length:177 start_codon:yes stop_codon:yes gene_type:complete
MPKSKHRKNHKKKVAARRERLEQKRRAFRKKLESQFGEEIAKKIAEQQKQSGEEPENV